MDQAQPTLPAAGGPQGRPLLYFAMWQRVPAFEKSELLASWGYDVRCDYSYNRDELNDAVERLLALKPAALVLSLDEFPGYTRSFALGLKAKSGLRNIPRIAVGGEAAQAELLVRALPDVRHCGWDELQGKLAELLGGDPPAADALPQAKVQSFL